MWRLKVRFMPGACQSDHRERPTEEKRRQAAAMAHMVCEAARQAALDAVSAVLSMAADAAPETAERVREIANQALSRATLLQNEIDRFTALVRTRRR
jgi:hypothetical protein